MYYYLGKLSRDIVWYGMQQPCI